MAGIKTRPKIKLETAAGTVLEVAGFGAIVAGVWMISAAAGLIVAGVLLIVAGLGVEA